MKDTDTPQDPAAQDTPAATEDSELSQLEEEGEVAADYIEELLDTADIDGDIEIEVRDGRTYVSVLAEDGDDADLRTLVGEHGETLEALQELVRLAVLSATDRRSRLILDVAGHRDVRAGELRTMADEAVSRATEEGGRVHLPPLSPYERKIVHDAVAEAGLLSVSEGEGAARHIVVSVGE
ncbi:R3H domain-containing nucleic acid-binding protein [Kocuria sp.]|uniref:Jag family protein n=1 Tax=Kocuria sp. TaxID=1871328 RepID=UPI0026DB20A0|nr:R3H domain-containing nucleic acid-binding protein [Kocuria sp.]MDO4919114.1 R3H domain-containing nucleic acid-binding protein [Kocuria sp.]